MEAGREVCAGGDKVRATVITQRLHETPVKAEGREDFRDYIFKVFSLYFTLIKGFFPAVLKQMPDQRTPRKKLKGLSEAFTTDELLMKKETEVHFAACPHKPNIHPACRQTMSIPAVLWGLQKGELHGHHMRTERRLSQSKFCGKVS